MTAAKRALAQELPPTPVAIEDLPQRVVSAKVPLRARLVALWGSRELWWFLVRKELKVRYKNSVLGFVWSFLNPALVLLIYYVVFKYFLHNTQPDFALYLFAGLLAWQPVLTIHFCPPPVCSSLTPA